jgi:hypothetical protein
MSFFIVTNIIAFFLIVQYLMPFQKPSEIIDHQEAYERIGLLRWEDGINHSLPQDFADMLGWKEMADKALAAYQTLPANEAQNTIIICDNYGQAGALNYYNRKKTKEAYSLQSDYIYWIPNNIDIKNMILVGDIPPEEVIGMFDSYALVGTVENEFARENGTGIYLMLGANSETSELFYKMIEERKKDFDIF